MSSARRRGMTLIEVMVVVAILLCLMSSIAVWVAGTFHESKVDTARIAAAREAEREEIERLRRGLAPAAPAVPAHVVSEDLDVVVRASPIAEWVRVRSRLDVEVSGRYVLENPDAAASAVDIALPMPARPRSLQVTAERAGEEPFVPADARYEEGRLRWAAALDAGETLVVRISYRQEAWDEVELPFASTPGRPVDADLAVQLPQGFEAVVGPGSPTPTGRAAGALTWALDGAVDPPAVTLSLPADRTPLGRIAAVCRLAALGLLLFCGGFWYLHEGERPGDLDDFRLGGLLLLALNYGTFYVAFAVLAPHVGGWAAPVAAVASLPLLGLHVARLTGPRFALTRAVPLAAGTIAAVLGYVWLDAWRSLVVVGAGVVGIGVVTVTWRSWSAGRRAWTTVRARQAVREARLARVEARASEVRQTLEARAAQLEGVRRALGELPDGLGAERAAVVRGAARLERAIVRSRALVATRTDLEPCGDAVHEARCAGLVAELDRALLGLGTLGDGLAASASALEAAAARAADELSAALAGMERAVDELVLVAAEARAVGGRAPEWIRARAGLDEALGAVDAVREAAAELAQRVTRPEGASGDLRSLAVTARQLGQGASRLSVALQGTVERLSDAARHADAPDDDAGPAVHCPSCGVAHVDGSRFCSGCGAGRPIELACGACGRVNRLARHLLRDGWHQEAVHCGSCGVALKKTA